MMVVTFGYRNLLVMMVWSGDVYYMLLLVITVGYDTIIHYSYYCDVGYYGYYCLSL